jgi:hypothetical protein
VYLEQNQAIAMDRARAEAEANAPKPQEPTSIQLILFGVHLVRLLEQTQLKLWLPARALKRHNKKAAAEKAAETKKQKSSN